MAGPGGATCGLSCGAASAPRGSGSPRPWGDTRGRDPPFRTEPQTRRSPGPGPGRRPAAPAAAEPGEGEVPLPAPRRRKFGFLPMMGISQGHGCSPLRRANGTRRKRHRSPGGSRVPSPATGAEPRASPVLRGEPRGRESGQELLEQWGGEEESSKNPFGGRERERPVPAAPGAHPGAHPGARRG